jgi:chaperonin GroES
MRLVKPTRDGILVDPIMPSEVQTRSGLVVPTMHQDSPAEGIVVELGVGAGPHVEVKIGDRVFFNRFNGQEVDIRNHRYKILPYNEILAIIEQ